MSVDFPDLNKTCRKDSYILPRIKLVDTTSGHELLIFMDAYAGCKKIKMDENDASHTTFFIDRDIYHNTVMLFGLINICVTYQRMVNKLFASLVGVTMEAYVNDILVNSFKRCRPCKG